MALFLRNYSSCLLCNQHQGNFDEFQKMSSPSFYLFKSNSAFLRASSASCLVPIMTHATQLTKQTALSPMVKSNAVILSCTSSGVLFLVRNMLPFFNMIVSMLKKTIPDTIRHAQYTPQHLANGFIYSKLLCKWKVFTDLLLTYFVKV